MLVSEAEFWWKLSGKMRYRAPYKVVSRIVVLQLTSKLLAACNFNTSEFLYMRLLDMSRLRAKDKYKS